MTELFRIFTQRGETTRSFETTDQPRVRQDIKSANLWIFQLQKLVELKKQRELAKAA